MIAEFRLPDLGEGLPEAEIVQWHVAPGDEVALNQTIAEVETAKAIVELPSPYAGTVSTLAHDAGEIVEVGDVLIAFEVAAPGSAERAPGNGERAPGSADAAPGPPAADAEPGPPAVDAEPGPPAANAARPQEPTPPVPDEEDERAQPNLVGYGAPPRSSDRPRRRRRASVTTPAAPIAIAPTPALVADAASAPEREAAPERPRSTPPVRRLARSLGVDLTRVQASGEDGLITRADVEQYAATPPVVPDAPPAQQGSVADARTVRLPIRGVRQRTAEAMVRSAFTAPHVTTFHTVDVTATMELLDELREDRRLSGRRIGVLAVAAKAVCAALLRHPELNAHWDEAAGEIIQYRYVNLGIAAATDRGLIVPNVKDADALTLAELADALGELAQTARAGKASLSDLAGGTFSITNFGVFGIDAGTPILNPGEAGILGLGAVHRRPWEYRGDIALRHVMTLSLSFDHRLVDGEQGARFLREVGDVLAQPGRAMLLR